MAPDDETGVDRLLELLEAAHDRYTGLVKQLATIEAELKHVKEIDRTGIEDLRREYRRELELERDRVHAAAEAVKDHLKTLNENTAFVREMKTSYPTRQETDAETAAITARLNAEFAAQNSRLSALERERDRSAGALEAQKAAQTKFFLIFGVLITLITAAVNILFRMAREP